jgi:hypothetical protein
VKKNYPDLQQKLLEETINIYGLNWKKNGLAQVQISIGKKKPFMVQTIIL